MRCRHSVVKFPEASVGNFARRVVYPSATDIPLAHFGR
jgi:hypothetical protein